MQSFRILRQIEVPDLKEIWNSENSGRRPSATGASLCRKGGRYGWKPSTRAHISRFELFEVRFLNSSFSSSNLSILAFRAQISQFELFELILLLKSGNQFPVQRFEATVSQSTVPSDYFKSNVQFELILLLKLGNQFPVDQTVCNRRVALSKTRELSWSFRVYIYIYIYREREIYTHIHMCTYTSYDITWYDII